MNDFAREVFLLAKIFNDASVASNVAQDFYIQEFSRDGVGKASTTLSTGTKLLSLRKKIELHRAKKKPLRILEYGGRTPFSKNKLFTSVASSSSSSAPLNPSTPDLSNVDCQTLSSLEHFASGSISGYSDVPSQQSEV